METPRHFFVSPDGSGTMRLIMGLMLALAIAGCSRAGAGANSGNGQALPRHPETVKATDRLNIVGLLYPASAPRGIVLLFHQAGSSKYEYDTIGPRLAAHGFTALAIDQRAGGTLFGDNSTVHMLGGSQPYLEAEKDLQGALNWAGDKKLPVIVWGSSYSSALVFLLAAQNPGKVQGLLAFSPGEYLGTPDMVRKAAARVSVPIFVTSAKDASEIAAAKAIIDASPAALKVRYVPPTAGVHGSSTLIPDRNAQGAEENWRAVEAFLNRVVPPRASPKP